MPLHADSQPRLTLTGGSTLRLLREAAEGSYSWVFRAELSDGSACAVKLPKPAFDDSGARISAEATWLSRHAHPYVVGLVGAGDGPMGRFLAMHWLDGQTLADSLRSGPAPPVLMLRRLITVAAALDQIHCNGAVHGDVQPKNVMFRSRAGDGGLVLIDPDPSQSDRQLDLWGLQRLLLAGLTGRDFADDERRDTPMLSPATPRGVRDICGDLGRGVAVGGLETRLARALNSL